MRTAIISDIHGNLLALDAVLADLDAADSDQIVCLGDVAAFGPQPGGVLARLRTVGCPVVMGNTDDWLLNPQPHELRDDDSQRVTEVELWSAQQLSPADLEQVRTFRPTLELSLGGDTALLCFHGSPQSKTDVILSTTPDAELERMLAGSRATIMAGGHSHTQMLRRIGNVTLLNPGSVGLPHERDLVTDKVRHPAWAEYAIVSWENQSLTIQFRRVPFDARALVQVALGSGMPHAEWWVRDWSTGGSR
jgi:putative phosphoesterase